MGEEKARILLVEDEDGLRDLLKAQLGRQGLRVEAVANAEAALAAAARREPDLLLSDLRLPGLDGVELIRRHRAAHPDVPVLVLSGYGKARDIVGVIREGAEDYLSKPVDETELGLAVARALEKRRLLAENRRLREELRGGSAGPAGMLGRSKPMQELASLVERLAPSAGTVLVQGESGAGKEGVARALHAQSGRSKGPFVDVNAGSLPAGLFEAELFGARKGAFTGADATREGLFHAAEGGTLFLDEVGEVPLESQAKLLRVLETHEVKMLGDSKPRKVDVRVIAATNRDLEEEVRLGRFRRDLYFRLSVLPLRVPPLRERMDDLPLLAEHFLQRFAGPDGPKRFSAAAMKRLLAHAWPGNVRELRNVVERAALLGTGEAVEAGDLYLDGGTTPLPSGPFAQAKRLAVAAFERAYAQRLLDDHGGNISQAARAAGLDRKNLQVLLKRHGLRLGRRA